ncbi:MAG: hypothetical protein M3N98_02535 [Actinomycetota bacterium]|nr:hypothetical protein [Actinomycetota bacterium]
MLHEAGKDGIELDTDLARLLPLETKAEYDPEDIPQAQATKAVERAPRCVAVARRLAYAEHDVAEGNGPTDYP